MKKLICIFVLILLTIPNISFASENDSPSSILKKQQETFRINDFIKESKKYSSEIFEDIDINNMFSSAISGKIDNNILIKKILGLLGKEITYSIRTLVQILVIVLIHTILKSISDGLNNNSVSKVIYYVQFILIVTLISSNITNILNIVHDTISNLVGFTNTLIPILIALMIYTGSITTSGLLEPIIIFIIEFTANLIQMLIIPGVSLIMVLIIASKISDQIQINKIAKFFKSSITWILGIILTVFVGILSLEGTLTSSVDGITAKATKAAVSNIIPVVGKIIGDSVDSVLGCGVVLKNAVGVVGTIIIVGICIIPIVKLTTLTIIYNLTSAIIEPIADKKIVSLIEEISEIFKILLAILCSMSVLLIVGITLIIKISNSGIMYR